MTYCHSKVSNYDDNPFYVPNTSRSETEEMDDSFAMLELLSDSESILKSAERGNADTVGRLLSQNQDMARFAMKTETMHYARVEV